VSQQRPSALREQAELMRMLNGLGQSTLSPHTPADERMREERMAARIDDQIANLSERRLVSRRIGVAFLAAAAVVLSLGGLRYLDWGRNQLTIEQEPIAKLKYPEPRSTASAAKPEAPASPPTRLVAPTARAGAASVPEVAPNGSNAEPEPQSTLGQENRLFKEAAEAARTGDVQGALTRFDRLLKDNPASPLAQTAQVRKFRLLAAVGRNEEARREAEHYLALYPTGFAVSEAQGLKGAVDAARRPADVGAAEAP
jgi:hypothetical protein